MIVCPFKDLGRYAAIIPGLEEAVAACKEITDFTPRTVQLSGGNKILVQVNTTKVFNEKMESEAHRDYLDIQYIVEGEEVIGWAPLETLTLSGEFNTAKDKGMYAGPVDMVRVGEGYCYVVFPEDAHMPHLCTVDPKEIKKLVLKLKV